VGWVEIVEAPLSTDEQCATGKQQRHNHKYDVNGKLKHLIIKVSKGILIKQSRNS
jgi:hypothetical protein